MSRRVVVRRRQAAVGAVVVAAAVVGVLVGVRGGAPEPSAAPATTATTPATATTPTATATRALEAPGTRRADEVGGVSAASGTPDSSDSTDTTAATGPTGPSGSAGDPGSSESPGSTEDAEDADRGAGVLAAEVPDSASGELVTVPGSQPATPGTDHVLTVRVQVERGLPADPQAVARTVMATLDDPRGWVHEGWGFARTDDAEAADVDLVLASPEVSERLCAPLETHGTLSCRNGSHVVLTWYRWVHGAEAFGDDRAAYRHYLVSHEVGHAIGHGHETCPAPGELAPVMMQQTKSTGECAANGWPYP